MSGHLIVDVHDGAWVTVNVGILNYNFDLFRAEICFKGKIEYELNILKVIKYSELFLCKEKGKYVVFAALWPI